MPTVPTQGRIVHYALSKMDASQITRHRRTATGRLSAGRPVMEGTIVPAIIVGVDDTRPKNDMEFIVALHCFLDGPDTYYVPMATVIRTPRQDEDVAPGRWFWPPGTRDAAAQEPAEANGQTA